LAIGFATQGARVGLLSRSKAELDLARLEIEHAGGSALPIRADVTEYEQLAAAAERLRSEFGRIQVLICAAGVQGPIGPLSEVSPQAWAAAITTNLVGVMNSCRAVLPPMVEQRKGKIIILAGGGASKPRPFFSAYAASKAAAVRFAETLAEEVRDDNIQVNCMSPGGTYTHMTDEILNAGEKAGWKDLELARSVRITGGVPPDRQIQLALFLASERSNHVNGKLIHVNDEWKRLEHMNLSQEVYTLRRIERL
jgi:3-oxoacyl-[acyl-carrier protein] reductase